MQFGGLSQIVDDLEATMAFYRDTLGLEPELLNPRYARVELDGIPHFSLWERGYTAEVIYGDAERREDVPLGFCMAYTVESVPDTAAELAAKGLLIIQQPRIEPWGQWTCRFLLPDGRLGELNQSH